MRKKILSRNFFCIVAIALMTTIAAPVLASPATATRTLPASVASGAEFDVTIEASGCGVWGQVVETLPDGCIYLSCTPDPADIGVEQIGNSVKFSFVEDPASFTYRVKAPTVEVTTTYTFQGIIWDQDRISYPIADDDIDVIPTITWDLRWGLDADPAAVNIWSYPVAAVEVTLADVEDSMPSGLLVWHYGGPIDGWQFYKKDWGAVNTLTSLVPGEGYIGIVPTSGQWDILQE